MEDESKTVQEVAKTTRKGIEATEKFGEFLVKILGEGFGHLGSAFSDWAKDFRYRNILKLIDRVDSIHKQRKIEGKPIPLLPKHVIPILEQASLEDNDGIRLLWAELIANATDPNRRFEIKKLYIEILSSLDPVDADVLFFLNGTHITKTVFDGNPWNAKRIAKTINKNIDDVKISLGNLYRHGLVIDSWEQVFENLDRGYYGFRVDDNRSNFRLSHLGTKLVEGCMDT